MPCPKPPGCLSCPAYSWGQGYVPGSGNPNAKLAFLGQGPGQTEHYAGRPFVGPSGQRFDGWLNAADLQRSAVWVDNVVRCWLPKSIVPIPTGNREPTPAEVAHCTQAHILPALATLPNLEIIIPVGLTAATWALGTTADMDDAGTIRDMWLPGALDTPEGVS